MIIFRIAFSIVTLDFIKYSLKCSGGKAVAYGTAVLEVSGPIPGSDQLFL